MVGWNLFCDSYLQNMLMLIRDFLLVRTNSKKIDFVEEISIKNRIDFSIKSKKLSIELE